MTLVARDNMLRVLTLFKRIKVGEGFSTGVSFNFTTSRGQGNLYWDPVSDGKIESHPLQLGVTGSETNPKVLKLYSNTMIEVGQAGTSNVYFDTFLHALANEPHWDTCIIGKTYIDNEEFPLTLHELGFTEGVDLYNNGGVNTIELTYPAGHGIPSKYELLTEIMTHYGMHEPSPPQGPFFIVKIEHEFRTIYYLAKTTAAYRHANFTSGYLNAKVIKSNKESDNDYILGLSIEDQAGGELEFPNAGLINLTIKHEVIS